MPKPNARLRRRVTLSKAVSVFVSALTTYQAHTQASLTGTREELQDAADNLVRHGNAIRQLTSHLSGELNAAAFNRKK